MKEFTQAVKGFTALSLAMFIAVVVSILVVFYPFSKWHCSSYSDAIGFPTIHNISGCFVTLPNGRVVTKNNYETLITNEYRLELHNPPLPPKKPRQKNIL